MSSDIGELVGFQAGNKNWSAAEAVRFVQGGLLSRGVFLTDQGDQLDVEREPVIDVSENIEFKCSQSAEETIHRVFQSQQMMEIFDRTIDKNRKSRSSASDVVVWGINVNNQIKSPPEVQTVDKTGCNFVSSVHYELLPVRSIYMTKNNVELKTEVLSALKDIEQKIKKLRYKPHDEFQDFFGCYGSHIHQGVIEFGGIISSTASTTGFRDFSRTKVTNMTTKVSKAVKNARSTLFQAGSNVKIGVPFKASEIELFSSLEYSEEELQEVTVNINVKGGPVDLDVIDKDEWKKTLAQNNGLWQIISRSCSPRPIWEFLAKYKDEFDNYFLLGNGMEEAWERVSGLTVGYNPLEGLRKDLRVWTELNSRDKPLTAERLQELSGIRYKHSITDEDWRDEAIYSKEIQVLLSKVTTKQLPYTKNPLTLQKIVTQLANILHPITTIDTHRFPGLQDIITKVTEFESTSGRDNLNTKTVEEIPDVVSEWVKEKSDVDTLRDLQNRLELTLKVLSGKQKRYSFLVGVGVMRLFGYNLSHLKFERYLSKDDFLKASSVLNEYLNKMSTLTNYAQKQALILKLALASSQQKEIAVEYMRDNMPDPMNKDVNEAYESAYRSDGTFDTMQFHVNLSLIRDIGQKSSSMDLVALVYSLKTQLSFSKQQHVIRGKVLSEFVTGHCNVFENLLDDIDMSSYYPQKLRYDDVIKLTSDLLCGVDKKPDRLPEVPWFFMKHIIGLDSSVRENCCIEVLYEVRDSFSEGVNSDHDDSNDEEIAFISDDEENTGKDIGGRIEEEPRGKTIHPLDLIYVTFLCADDFLRQELADKMLQCQYAVPFILPSMNIIPGNESALILRWGLSSIRRNYSYQGRVENKALINLEAPLISCVSIGRETSWKSKLLNKMLSPQQETFWHQGLKGGDYKQKISQGMVEVAWYLPGGHKDDIFSRPLAFANMRGIVEDSETVSNILQDGSSVTCIFAEKIDDSFINYLNRRKKILTKTLLIILHREEEAQTISRRCARIQKNLRMENYQIISHSTEDSNFIKVYNQMKNGIDRLNEKQNVIVSLSQFAKQVSTDPFIDVDQNCSYGQKVAERIIHDIDDINKRRPGSAKAEILPCQSDLVSRQEIAASEKELCRQSKWKEDVTVQKYTAGLKKKKWELQLRQLHYPISSTYRYFLQCLTTMDREDRHYFLQALKLGLNERSSQYLEPLYQEYTRCRLEDESKARDKRLQEIDDNIKHGSLGLEHFFREMAIMYDNIDALISYTDGSELAGIRYLLAETMAELFLEGTAVEIMDGDSVTVPITWLESVLAKVPGNQHTKVFKVSVLGAQSCGKSTLLNTVFGLNFPVSSGRCTRGAYMQLVKVDIELKKKLGCDYVLVIDSEGLMSRDIGSDSDFDNELSTFIIGLSDLTLVIIKGEGNEMQDVLPLAIHVFLRMNIVGEHQSCHFVHQNMGAVDAMSKVESEIDKFIKDLNLKTLTAAKEAGQSEQYTKFTDVLQCDPSHDNTYVPGLWNGTPPMGSTNVHYSDKMLALKFWIVNCIKEIRRNHGKNMTTIQNFTLRLYELWDAVKYENFVFSFKNVLAVEAYRKLQNEFDDMCWKVKCEVREMIDQEETCLRNKVASRKYTGDVIDLISHSLMEVAECVTRRGDELKKDIFHYFHCSTGCEECNTDIQNRHLLSNYERNFQDDIEILQKSLVRELNSSMDKLELRINADKTIGQMDEEINYLLKEGIKEEIEKYKSRNLGNDRLEAIFEEWWKRAASYILRRIESTLKPVNIEATVQAAIMKVLKTDSHWYKRATIREGLEPKYTEATTNVSDPVLKMQHKYFRMKSFRKGNVEDAGKKPMREKVEVKDMPENLSDHAGFWDEQDLTRLGEISDGIIAEAEKYCNPKIPKEFVEKDAERLFKMVKKKIKEINEEKFSITDRYKGDLFAHIEVRAIAGFQKMHDNYMKENSPKAILERKKENFRSRFMHLMGQEDLAITFSQTILGKVIQQNVLKQLTCSSLLDDLRKHGGDMFKHSKNLNAKVMLDLLRMDDFQLYFLYVTNYDQFIKDTLMTGSLDFFKQNRRLKERIKNLAEKNIQGILHAVDRTVESHSGDLFFIKSLLENIESLVVTRSLGCEAMEDLQVPDKLQFGQCIHEQLTGPVKGYIFELVDSIDEINILQNAGFPDFLFQEIVSCTAKCPFCNAPCDAHSGGRKSGRHSASIHRPPGLSGYRSKGIFIFRSSKLFVESCNALVASKQSFLHNPTQKYKSFRKYHKYYPDWEIEKNADPDVEKYWKWVFAKYNDAFALNYGTKPAKIPLTWQFYEKEDIEEEIKKKFPTQTTTERVVITRF